MSSLWGPVLAGDLPQPYEIRLAGHLSQQWTDWFDGLTITLEAGGVTRLCGSVVDQAALHRLLKKVRDLGLPLLSVNCVAPGSAGAPAVTPPPVIGKEA